MLKNLHEYMHKSDIPSPNLLTLKNGFFASVYRTLDYELKDKEVKIGIWFKVRKARY